MLALSTYVCTVYVDIGHPVFWVDKEGKNPSPFTTTITYQDIQNGATPLFDNIYTLHWHEELA